MKILAVEPGFDFSVSDVYAGWLEGLAECGVQVAEYNLTSRLRFYSTITIERDGQHDRALSDDDALGLALNGMLSALYQTSPDVLLVVSGFFIPTEMLDFIRSKGTRIALVHTEQPYELDRELNLAGHADVNIVNDPTHLDRFTELGSAWYQPHCYRPGLHRPGTVAANYRSEFAFVGTGYPSRVEFFEAVDFTGVDVALAGSWQTTSDDSPLRKYLAHDLDECCDNTDTVRLYQGARLSANLYRKEAHDAAWATGWAMGPREVEMAACGLPFLREPRPESDVVFPFLPSFTTPGEFTDQMRWLLAHEDTRADLGRQARAAVADRTFASAAARLLDHFS